VFVAKIEVLLNGPFVHVHPVLVKGVSNLIVKRRAKNFEVAVPLRAAKKDQMVFVDLAYTGDDFAI
jgi:cytochrome oxidase assembly protein ShyY1